ncbi:hypothetical protein [Sphingomonas colocasiae]|uniref:DUF3617 family protein n=1 Tax=Sphingomonas colocasiae TaxID=1848973 RepID=A0ABS7PJ66_9SPHN|nr:hypothetical protein [Sphingomonas colocasiae]MBY8821298.1 hypothetical protein [Sphingomonas colocasiae]
MRPTILLPITVALLMLAACEPDSSRQAASNDAVTVDIAGPSAQAPSADASAEKPRPAPIAVPQTGFAGLWAVDEKSCKSPPWHFTERDLTTKGEVYCSFKQIKPVADGYDINTVCAAEGDEVAETMRLRLKNAGRTMTVSSDQTYKPIDLIRCQR